MPFQNRTVGSNPSLSASKSKPQRNCPWASGHEEARARNTGAGLGSGRGPRVARRAGCAWTVGLASSGFPASSLAKCLVVRKLSEYDGGKRVQRR
jgi:hypothetical protein